MAYIKIWIHAVWTTKNREKYLIKDVRQKLFKHMREDSGKKGIYIDFINGYEDHVHCLISLTARQNIADVINLIKGESSHWTNENKLIPVKFGWQRKYFAVSVSELVVNRVREYIKNQEKYHQEKSYQDEHDEFIREYGFDPSQPFRAGKLKGSPNK